MFIPLCLSCAALAVVLYRLCLHHPRRWRAPRLAGMAAAVLLAVIVWLAAREASVVVAVFIVLNVMMAWLALVPLLATWWRWRSHDGA
jgi:hypothetical protein